ncbi:DNA-directed RNA polymerase subunit alpha [Candidatus Bandiella euplotis]|uniref:DNA-directed RNA polymerase subunit alpha n=1 Tax=Candidatus Bandiella euplotis TaxID=1664265 RepID=A0ABZ0ULL0_9RICK|nr:DNA-directed RNA polymerase subunit alpha [Candidatus Bandiella woodruffii]WPX97028.1 DNA-directed RNA polymerase subunit alpha [Candidatus Bandiella woodruffii]
MQEATQGANISLNWVSLIKPASYSVEKSTDNVGVFSIEPLERGFGVTLGNALRRILLSSLQGTAISAVRISGVEHEYSTIEGVKEDVVEIILNLKSVIISGSAGFDNKKFTLSVSKSGPVTAGMIKVSDGFQITNPDLVICNITKETKLEMEFIVTSGKGYRVASEQQDFSYGSNFIAIDSIFSPVLRCSFKVENSRVGSKTEYDKLLLTIETNGAIKSDLALAFAAKIFQEQLQVFINFREVEEVEKPKEKVVPFDLNLLRKVCDMELSIRSQNCLKNDNIIYIGDLVTKTETQMLKIPNFGKKSLYEIRDILAEMGLKFGMEIKDWPPKNVEELAKTYIEDNN